MDALDRHWKILRMIPRRQRISTTEIRTRLELNYGIKTTLRTIQRDMISLSGQFPLECDESSPAGWRWMKDAPAFDIPGMDPVAALAFSLAEKHITQLLPHSVLTALNPYFRTAEYRLAHTTESRLSTWPDKVRVDQKTHKQKDGLFELTATLADTFQLRWWLRGYGDEVEVLAPEALRQEFVEMTRELKKMYGGV